MRIKTRLQVSVIFTFVLAITAGLFLFTAVQSVNEGSRKERIAAEIVKGMAELKIVTHEYLLHPGERALIQWQSRYDSLIKRIRESEFKRSKEKFLLDEILQHLLRFKSVFVDVTKGYGDVKGFSRPKVTVSPELQKRLIAELLVKSQATISPVFQLQQAIQADVMADQQRTGFLIVILLVILTSFITAISLLINMSVGRPIAKLQNGIQIIGSGNLDHKVGTSAKDEIGQLSRAFDKMTNDLKKTTASIVDLNREIDERKQVEAALRESEEIFKKLFEFAPDGFYLNDLEGNFIDGNKVAQEIIGYKKEELVGSSFLKLGLLPPEEIPKAAELLIENFNGRATGPDEFILNRKDGTQVVVEIMTIPVTIKSQKVILGIARDITEKKLAEEEKKKLEAQLQQAQKMEAIGTLAGGIAHDFNNMLAAVLGNISLARMETGPGSNVSELLTEAEKASMRAKELTARLITFSRGGEPVKEVTSIGDMVKDSVSSTLSDSGIDYEISIPDDLSPVEIDEVQMKQVIYGITTNALEAMTGKGLIKVYCENSTVEEKDALTLRKGKYVRISIEDQGVGIPKEDLQKIFDPYFSTKEMGPDKGQGLGLSICHSIVAKHDGLIAVESELGVGTTFSIYLPAIALAQARPAGLPASEIEIAEPEPIKKAVPARPVTGRGKILVMDDEEMVRNVSAAMLRKMGCEVELAVDGVEAIEMYKGARESGEPFDVVILDLTNQFGMGGKEAIEKLLEIDPDVKAIISSGYSNDPIMSNFGAYGFRGVLAKPFTMDELSKGLNGVITGKDE